MKRDFSLLATAESTRAGSYTSAATAEKLFEGQSKDEVWRILTAMFLPYAQQPRDTKTFIYSGAPFDEKVRGSQYPEGETQIGDIFEATTTQGNSIFVKIVEWQASNRLAYLEQMWPSNEEVPSMADSTDIIFESESEGTRVTITRRERHDFAIRSFSDAIWVLVDTWKRRDWAAGRLDHIIGGGFRMPGNGKSVVQGGFRISRDDSLRTQ